jgi:micrococcal nuclease
MNIKKKRIINLVIELVILLIITAILFIVDNNTLEIVKLDSCIDGDTAKFITSERIKTIRFLAIDTPETVDPRKEVQPFGKEASTFTCNELKNAKNISIELDINSDKYDKYDRLLAWVFVDNILLQDKLVKVGYAKVAYLYDDYKYTNILLRDEQIAKTNRLGIWYNE